MIDNEGELAAADAWQGHDNQEPIGWLEYGLLGFTVVCAVAALVFL